MLPTAVETWFKHFWTPKITLAQIYADRKVVSAKKAQLNMMLPL